MSVLDKSGSNLRTMYAEYVALCNAQNRTPEPAENFEDAQDVMDTITAMREAETGVHPIEISSNEGNTPGGIV